MKIHLKSKFLLTRSQAYPIKMQMQNYKLMNSQFLSCYWIFHLVQSSTDLFTVWSTFWYWNGNLWILSILLYVGMSFMISIEQNKENQLNVCSYMSTSALNAIEILIQNHWINWFGICNFVIAVKDFLNKFYHITHTYQHIVLHDFEPEVLWTLSFV